MMNTEPLHFFCEPIEVHFNKPLNHEKTPSCPHKFIWRGEEFTVKELFQAWCDFNRRGRMARNMRPAHASRASRIGSLGVGRFYFQILTTDARIFVLYYDRAPKGADDRSGNWYLLEERQAASA